MERWRMVVELTYDPIEGDTNINEVSGIEDFGTGIAKSFGKGNELYRAKGALDTLLRGSVFKHYHVIALPHRCVE